MKTAISLGCDVAVIKTLIEVEGSAAGFLQSEEPAIRFHRDVFSRQTLGVYDAVAPDVSNPVPDENVVADQQHQILHKAILLNKDAALMATAWGKFQIMGYNYALAGFSSLQEFVSAMYQNEGAQLTAFANLLSNLSLDEDLRKKDWKGFAAKYTKVENRSDFAQKLLNTYASFEAR
ncbi:N-acetylmuramidase domain-containing protein [Niabella insulamsoli]|uniref:N-acetylmuramidase domain-containing protein n=1 Tax=Niabella insulamsoli TaxID=3144874 RepID=UPI0031FBE8E0